MGECGAVNAVTGDRYSSGTPNSGPIAKRRGAGLQSKIKGLELGRARGLDTLDAYVALGLTPDPRSYERPAAILRHFGTATVRLLTNNPRKVQGLEMEGITVNREPIEIAATPSSRPYLETKARKMGHLLSQFRNKESA